MHLRRSQVFISFLFVAYAQSAAPARVDVPVWAVAFLQSWYSAYNDGDASRLAALYSSDAFLGINNGHNGASGAMGSPSIGASLARESEKARRTCKGDYDGLQQLGTLGVPWGHDTCTQNSSDSVAPKETHRRWLRVLVPTKSGQWVATRDEIEDVEVAKD
jgi:hypothetical protein